MCAWLHVAIASELDFLYALLGASDSEGSSASGFTAPPSITLKPSSGSTIVPSPLVCGLLDTIIGSVVPPLCSRIHACASASSSPVILLKTSNIVQFYVQAVAPLLPNDSLAVDLLTEAHAHVRVYVYVVAFEFFAPDFRVELRLYTCLAASRAMPSTFLTAWKFNLCPRSLVQVVAAFHGALRCLADANSNLLEDLGNRYE
jgi:hypothetical protein